MVIYGVSCGSPRTSEANGRNSNNMLIFQMDIRKDDLSISKVMKILLLEICMTRISDHKINRRKFDESGITPFYFPPLMNMAIFGHFSQYRSKG